MTEVLYTHTHTHIRTSKHFLLVLHWNSLTLLFQYNTARRCFDLSVELLLCNKQDTLWCKKKRWKFHSQLSFPSWLFFLIYFLWHEIFGRERSIYGIASPSRKCSLWSSNVSLYIHLRVGTALGDTQYLCSCYAKGESTADLRWEAEFFFRHGMVYGIDTAKAGVWRNSSLENYTSQSKSDVCGQGRFLFVLA